MLDAADPKYGEIPPTDDPRLKLPYLQIWYQPPAAAGDQELTDEEEAILKSIGYGK
jgi:hypothetical protein